MKMGKKLFKTVVLLSLLNLTAQAEMHKWTSTTGTTIDAEFVKLKYDVVYLKTTDGETKKIPKSKLSQDDQLLVTKLSNPFAGNKAVLADNPKASDAIYNLFGEELRDARKNKKGKPFEIVFVSSDRDKSSMYDYMKEMEMPWLALPFGDSHKEALSKKFNVSGIPKLVIIDANGKLITENGRGAVSSKGNDAFDDWQ